MSCAYDPRGDLTTPQIRPLGCPVAGQNVAMVDLTVQLDLGDLRLRTLVQDDAELLVEATRHEQAPALWAPRPAGPYSLDAVRELLAQ
jgi:hypothetical protein